MHLVYCVMTHRYIYWEDVSQDSFGALILYSICSFLAFYFGKWDTLTEKLDGAIRARTLNK